MGEIKVGYLMYNQFAQGFDDDLNEIFSDFKAKEINELVLDLRNNGGGLVRSATNLAGMITGQFNGQVFAKYCQLCVRQRNQSLVTPLNCQ